MAARKVAREDNFARSEGVEEVMAKRKMVVNDTRMLVWVKRVC